MSDSRIILLRFSLMEPSWLPYANLPRIVIGPTQPAANLLSSEDARERVVVDRTNT
jgi:hypothetical protein